MARLLDLSVSDWGDSMQQLERTRFQAWELYEEAHTAQKQGSAEKAIRLYRKSLRMHPTAEAYTFLGWSYSYQGKFNPAIQLCRLAIQVDPDYGNPYNDIGAYMIELGCLDEAVPWLEKALNAKRYDSYCFPWMNLGRIWERKGQWVRALKCYKQALLCDPNFTVAIRAIGRIRGRLN